MTCPVRRCSTERFEPDDDDDFGVCHSCCLKIARRYKQRILSEERSRKSEAMKALAVNQAASRARPSIPDLFAAYEQPEGTTFVYYVRIHDKIKIGYTSRVLQRLQALRVPVENLLALEPGGRALEQSRHELFDHLRVTRRWENFEPGADLMAHIEAVRGERGLPRWLQSPRRGRNGPVEVRRAN